ncbi:MAG: GerAB/ArcD/ProY family transporter [Bacillota bacterium]
MDKKESAIVPSQVISLVALSSVGIRLLALPSEVAQVVGRDGAIVTLIAGVIALGEVYILARHCLRFPNQYYQETLYLVYGKILGHLFNGFLAILLTLVAGVALREFSATIRVTILNVTPPWVIWLTMLLTSCYLVSSGLETMARLFDILLLLTLTVGSIIAIVAIQQMELTNLLPILAQKPVVIGKGVFVALRAFQQFAIVAVLVPHLRHKRRYLSRAMVGMGVVVSFYTLAVLQCLAAFGPGETAFLTSPLLTLARAVDVPYSLIERLEALLMTEWIPIGFALVSSHHYIIELFFSKVWHVPRRYRPITILFIAAAIGVIASLPRDITTNIRISDMLDFVTISIGVVFIPVTYLIAVIRGKRGEQDEGQSPSRGRAES